VGGGRKCNNQKERLCKGTHKRVKWASCRRAEFFGKPGRWVGTRRERGDQCKRTNRNKNGKILGKEKGSPTEEKRILIEEGVQGEGKDWRKRRD